MAEPQRMDAARWAALYTECRGEMTGFARRHLTAAGIPTARLEAEDVVHTAFARAMRRGEAVREPRAYVYEVMRRELVNIGRREFGGPQALALSTGVPEAVVPDFADQIANRLTVRKALGLLPPMQQQAVWATKGLEYTQAETATVMGKQPGTVATHVSRAVRTLLITLGATITVVLIGLFAALAPVLRGRAAGPSGESEPYPDPPLLDGRLMDAVLGFASGATLTTGLILGWILLFRPRAAARQAAAEPAWPPAWAGAVASASRTASEHVRRRLKQLAARHARRAAAGTTS